MSQAAQLQESATPLARVSATTTRALIDSTSSMTGVGGAAVAGTATKGGIFVQADPDNDKKLFIGDGTVVAAGSAGVICCLPPGMSATLPLKSTAGLNVVMFTGSAGGSLYVSVLQ